MKLLSERQWVTVGIFALAAGMLLMARENPKLWEVKLFEILIQAVVLTGVLNMVGAFHFAANKSDDTKAENTGKAFDAIKAAANSAPPAEGPSGTAADPLHTVDQSEEEAKP